MTKAFIGIFKQQVIDNIEALKTIQPRIINVTSMAGLTCGPTLASYSSSKHAAEAFSSTLRYEMANWGVRCITCNPSFHKTPLVGGIAVGINRVVSKMNKSDVSQYGKKYIDTTIHMAIKTSSMNEWDADNVTRALTNAVVQRKPHSQMLVGTDAKFGITLIRHLPVWFQDFVFILSAKFGKGLPQILVEGDKRD